jgi:hypothetical protein
MLPINLALVSEVAGHDQSDVARVAASLQRQATRDFGPLWEVSATLDAFPRLEDVPVGYWPIIVETDINTPGAAGVHEDKNGQPFALVSMSDSWSLTASHEMLEMLADPFGKRVIPGKSPKEDQGRVEFLVEVCDPCEADQFAYTVNDILVSDFITTHFYDPQQAASVRYSLTGAVKGPREILPDGYISWHDPVSDHWWQQTWFDNSKQFKDLGIFEAAAGSLRAWIDAQTQHPGIDHGLERANPTLEAAVAVGHETSESSSARAQTWREQIAELKAQ